MRIGYARVSTADQNLDLQRRALRTAGCERVIEDFGQSGAERHREGLERVLDEVGHGDTLVVWRLDRLGRSLFDLIEILNALSRKGAEFHSLTENIDTNSSGGRLVFHMMGALAEFERSLISERTRAGMAAAKKSGVHIGRPYALTSTQVAEALGKLSDGSQALEDVAKDLKVHPKTLKRALNRARKG